MGHVQLRSGIRLAVRDLGVGPVVVFIAGFGLTQEVWDRQVRELAADHRVICIDQRGHGGSDKPLDGYEVTELADDLVEALELLDVTDCTLVGWSFGGQVAFHAAAMASALVSRLVLVGSNAVRASRSEAFPFGRDSGTMLPVLIAAEQADRLGARRTTIVSGFGAAPAPALVDWLVGLSMQMPSWATVACYRSMLTADLVAELGQVKQPVLQIIGADDPVHSAKGARWLCEQLGDSRLVEIDGCGHYPMFEAADEFAATLADFLA